MNYRRTKALALAMVLGIILTPLFTSNTSSVTAQSNTDAETMGLLGTVRYCIDEECLEMRDSVDGVTLTFGSEDGTVEYGSCKTVADAAPDGCSVQVPIDVPVAVTIDESTIPEGTTPFESTIVTTVTNEPGFFAVTFGLLGGGVPPAPEGVFFGSLYGCAPPATEECGDVVPGVDVYMAMPGTDNMEFATTDQSGQAMFALDQFASPEPAPVEFGMLLDSWPNGEIAEIDARCAVSGEGIAVEVSEGEVVPGGAALKFQFVATEGDSVSCNIGLVGGSASEPTAEVPEAGATQPAEIVDPQDGPEEPVDGELTGLGLSFDEWEAVYGEGAQVEEPNSTLFEYPNPEFDGFTLFANFPDGLTEHVELGYEEAEAGGLPVAEIADQVASILPTDAELQETYAVPADNPTDGTYRIERYLSAALGDVAENRAGILVVYQVSQSEPDPEDGSETLVSRVTLTIPTAGIGEETATGNPGAIGLTQDDFELAYGNGEATQSGIRYALTTSEAGDAEAVVQFAGPDDTMNVIEIIYGAESQLGGTSREIVTVDVSAALPSDAVRAGSYFLPATPEGPVGLIAERWESPTLGSIVVIIEQKSVQQNPGSPEQTVVPHVTIVVQDND